jgi:hypothetical protein
MKLELETIRSKHECDIPFCKLNTRNRRDLSKEKRLGVGKTEEIRSRGRREGTRAVRGEKEI